MKKMTELYIKINKNANKTSPKQRHSEHWDWDQIWLAINRRIAMELAKPSWNPAPRIDWSTWARQRGLVPSTNDAMTTLVCHVIADVKIRDKTFKAWKSGERVFPKLCTVIAPPGLDIFVQQNKLSRV